VLSKTFHETQITDVDHKTNHYLINSYKGSVGIMPHTDGPLYHPYVTVVSLGSPILFKIYTDMNAYAAEEEKANVLVESGSLLVFTGSFYHNCLHSILENVIETIRVDYEVKHGVGETNSGLNGLDTDTFRLKKNASSVDNLDLTSIYAKYLKQLENSTFQNVEQFALKVENLNKIGEGLEFKYKLEKLEKLKISVYVSWKRDKRISLTIRHVKIATE
jgi:alkylated DNA repair protein alkB family protein 6